MTNPLQPTTIVDKNGVTTTRNKKIDEPTPSVGAERAAAITSASSGDPRAKPIDLEGGESYSFLITSSRTSGDGVGIDSIIYSAELWREDGADVEAYVLTGKSQYLSPVYQVGERFFGYDTDMSFMLIRDNKDKIDKFLLERYDADEVEWTDDLEAQLVWYHDSATPMSVNDAWDVWEKTDAERLFDESQTDNDGARAGVLWSELYEFLVAQESAQ